MVKPKPVPPYFLLVLLSAWVNASNTLSFCSSLIPIPVSLTINLTVMSSLFWIDTFSITTSIVPLSSVNLTAFEIKLISTCLIFTGSDFRRREEKDGSIHNVKSISFLAAFVAYVSITFSNSSIGLKKTSSSSTYPFSIFDISRISLIIESKSSELFLMIWTNSSCSLSKFVDFKNFVKPTIPLSGVLISWDIFAKKRLFVLFASSAVFLLSSSSLIISDIRA